MGSGRDKGPPEKRSEALLNQKKPSYVAFLDRKLESEFELLNQGKFQDKQLYAFLLRAIADLKKDPSCGTKIQKSLWPKEYNVTNLWKYDLPNAWRLIYTIKEDEVMIVSLILEWFDHKGYERRFRY